MHKITGKIQHYDWGGSAFIPQFLQQKAENLPYAEYWLGAHPSAPSELDNGQNLLDWLAENPHALSAESRQRFGEQIPFLLKILDVSKPLSIQVHPSKKQAEQGFAQEEAQGIARNAPERTYKDQNHKPEMMIALSDFWLLHGFKSEQAIAQTLQHYPSLHELLPILQTGGIRGLYEKLLFADQSALSRWLSPMLDAPPPSDLNNPDYWLHETMRLMKISREQLDAGLMSFYVMNIVALRAGEGIFQGAGLPHAYLRGQNIELMACSDNVVRGGLTPKYIDKSALLAITDFAPVVPQIIAPANASCYGYPTPPTDFSLLRQQLNAQTLMTDTPSALSILLVMEGRLTLNGQTFVRGESALLMAGETVVIEAQVDSWWVVAR